MKLLMCLIVVMVLLPCVGINAKAIRDEAAAAMLAGTLALKDQYEIFIRSKI